MDKSINQGMFTAKNNEPVSVGHPQIDNLNRQFGVNLIKPMLHELYQLPAKGNLRTAQHREHGLHLWYELGLDEQADVMAAAKAFSALPEVEFAEPVFRKALMEPVSAQEITEADLLSTKMSPSDQLYGLQWGFNNTGQSIRGTYGRAGADIGAEAAWETVQGNPGIIVAVIDQGFEYGHPDLSANVWPGIGPEGTATVAGNHGTHVAGTIAAVSNNGIGVAGTAGANGSISPTGTISVGEGSSQAFAIEPKQGYEIADIQVNGVSKGAIDSYTFNNVSEDQTIFAAFSEVWTDPCLVTHLPYLQDFNASSFIPNCWGTQVNTGFTDNTGNPATFSRTIHALAGQLFIRLSQDVDSGMLTVNDLQGRELQRLDVQNLRSG